MSEPMTSAEVALHALPALCLIVVTAQLAGRLAGRFGQPRVLGEILGGIALGPSLLGLAWPQAHAYAFPDQVVGALNVLAQLGLVLFMFLLGLEIEWSALRGQGRKAVAISQVSVVLPLLLGAGTALWLYPRMGGGGGGGGAWGFCLFLGAAMSITAFPVLARLLLETGLHRTRIGVLTIACAAVDDVTAWCLLAVVVAVVGSAGAVPALVTLGLAIAYVCLMLFVVRPLLADRRPPLWAVLSMVLLSAWATDLIGIHAIFGGFLAGVIMPRRQVWRTEIHHRLDAVVSQLLLPVFFMTVGVTTRIDALDSLYFWGITGLLTAVAIAGKLGGATLTARLTGESWTDSTVIGVLMNTRGLTEIVILTVGLQLGVITETLFTAMVLMALTTTLMAAPLLRLVHPGQLLTPGAADHHRTPPPEAPQPAAPVPQSADYAAPSRS
ncbi:cation:proton antiporter [Streptomyces ficellus]|uniref:Cation:proton antiporter n=1 Tax=Streptomyces ficellus TaxID=1977088 RepID=A0ABT7Z6C8_9ACTN|nr:cation:proton antiporter [Streptomyces ficellus]MDN3295055.1 cation:proton antiporter [Streptomyces ficellus]